MVKKKMFSTAYIYSVLSAANLIIAFISSIILARILTPADFGLFAFVIVSAGLVKSFFGFSLNLNIISEKELDDE